MASKKFTIKDEYRESITRESHSGRVRSDCLYSSFIVKNNCIAKKSKIQ